MQHTLLGYIVWTLRERFMEHECCYKKKHTPRDEKDKKAIISRLHRVAGQLNGICGMIEGDRYCGDVLVQVSAAEHALQSIAYLLLEEHLSSCVTDDIQNGKMEVIPETMEIIKKI